MLKDTHSAWHFWFMINFFWRVLCWSHCLCSFPSHAWSHHLTPNFCVRKSFSVIAVLNLCIVSITFAHFLLGLEMLCSHGVPPPPQSSLWNTSQMLSSPGIALAITYWWPSSELLLLGVPQVSQTQPTPRDPTLPPQFLSPLHVVLLAPLPEAIHSHVSSRSLPFSPGQPHWSPHWSFAPNLAFFAVCMAQCTWPHTLA